MIKFTKMHGLGNDFVVIDATTQKVDLSRLPISQLANRHFGIGFDQLLLIEPSTKADFNCRIFNGDNSEAEQCGNGLRCVARFIHEKKLSPKKSFSIETKAGVSEIDIVDYSAIQVSMGVPTFQPEKIPFLTDAIKNLYELNIKHEEENVKLAVLSMGNPHALMQVNSLDNFPVAKLGIQIAAHSSFPQSTNVGFMEVVNRELIRLRTFERGSGETFACGSNACAAVVAGINNNLLDDKVKVELQFGDIWVEWKGEKKPVVMTGSATLVFEGEILL
jgi:diaminopimelate epimerase